MTMQSDIMRRLAAVADRGWDGIDDPQGLISEGQRLAELTEREEAKRQARVLAACFETVDGRACLALLRQKTIEAPPTQAELDERDPHAFALQQARKQGAANVVWMIEAALALARGDEKEGE